MQNLKIILNAFLNFLFFLMSFGCFEIILSVDIENKLACNLEQNSLDAIQPFRKFSWVQFAKIIMNALSKKFFCSRLILSNIF